MRTCSNFPKEVKYGADVLEIKTKSSNLRSFSHFAKESAVVEKRG